jgi:hypothetical protein
MANHPRARRGVPGLPERGPLLAVRSGRIFHLNKYALAKYGTMFSRIRLSVLCRNKKYGFCLNCA